MTGGGPPRAAPPAALQSLGLPPAAGRWLAALIVFGGLAALCLRQYFPPLASPLIVELATEKWPVGQAEPLIVSGRAQAGDFLYVRYQDETTLVFGYEAWGKPGQLSAPIKSAPGERVRLEIETPALTQIRGWLGPPAQRLRVRANGATLFDADVNFHLRERNEIWFGENPIGGTACDAALGGRLLLPDGRELRGPPGNLFSLPARLRGWLFVSPWQAVVALLAGVATFFVWDKIRWRGVAALAVRAARGERVFAEHSWGVRLARRLGAHRWFAGAAAVCAFVFAWMLTDGGFKFNYAEGFGSFYDFQAVSILQGRLDVPDEAISGEAFIAHGKRYGYFGPTPAVLRIPFVIFGTAFGRLSRSFMLVYFIATLIAAYLLLRDAARLVGDAEPSAWSTVVLTASVGLGSTLFYVGSRAYIYHEAILCGAMFALFACWCALRHFEKPAGRWWFGAWICGVLSVHARAPTGLFALTVLGCVAAALLIRDWRAGASLRRQGAIGVLSVVGVLSFNALSYAKFGTFDGCPLRLNVQYDAARLAKIDGKNFHLVNLPVAWATYITQPNFRLEARFPYFRVGSDRPKRQYPKSKLDYAENTLAMPYAMPGLFALATLGSWGAFVFVRRSRPSVAIVWAASLPAGLAMFTAIAVTQRYTGDFCPFLICAAGFGLAALDRAAPVPRHVLRFVFGAATVAAVLITFLITLQYQAEGVWGVPAEVTDKYHQLGKAMDELVAAFRR